MFRLKSIHVVFILLLLVFVLHAQYSVKEYFQNDSDKILKSEVVPPVCPKCPDVVNTCGKCEKPPPCPPCARCPEPSFECKKVPVYNSKWNSNTSGLPRPNLDSIHW